MSLKNDRAKSVVHWLITDRNLRQYQIAEMLGYKSLVNFSQLMTGKKPIPSTFPQKLASLDPRINLDYLRGDSDVMLLDKKTPSPAPVQASPKPEALEKFHDTPEKVSPAPQQGALTIPPELATMFSDMAYTIRSQQDLITKLLNEE